MGKLIIYAGLALIVIGVVLTIIVNLLKR